MEQQKSPEQSREACPNCGHELDLPLPAILQKFGEVAMMLPATASVAPVDVDYEPVHMQPEGYGTELPVAPGAKIRMFKTTTHSGWSKVALARIDAAKNNGIINPLSKQGTEHERTRAQREQ